MFLKYNVNVKATSLRSVAWLVLKMSIFNFVSMFTTGRVESSLLSLENRRPRAVPCVYLLQSTPSASYISPWCKQSTNPGLYRAVWSNRSWVLVVILSNLEMDPRGSILKHINNTVYICSVGRSKEHKHLTPFNFWKLTLGRLSCLQLLRPPPWERNIQISVPSVGRWIDTELRGTGAVVEQRRYNRRREVYHYTLVSMH